MENKKICKKSIYKVVTSNNIRTCGTTLMSYLKKNHGVYCKIKINPKSFPNKPIFDSFFISYLAQINGFKEAYRLFIGLD